MYLPYHPESVRLVMLLGFGVHRGRRLERTHEELRWGLPEPATQHGKQTAAMLKRLVELLDEPIHQQPLCKSSLHRRVVIRHDPRPLLRLRHLKPRKHVLRNQRMLLVIAGEILFVQPAMRAEVLADLGLETLLVLNTHYVLLKPQSGLSPQP